MCKRGAEQKELDYKYQDKALALGGLDTEDRVVIGSENGNG